MIKVFFDTNIMIDVIGRRELDIVTEFSKFMKITTATLVDSSMVEQSVKLNGKI